MKKLAILGNDISDLQLSNNILKVLNDNNVMIVEDLWKLKRSDLKKYGFSDSDINEIIVKLQLHALDLNKKVY